MILVMPNVSWPCRVSIQNLAQPLQSLAHEGIPGMGGWSKPRWRRDDAGEKPCLHLDLYPDAYEAEPHRFRLASRKGTGWIGPGGPISRKPARIHHGAHEGPRSYAEGAVASPFAELPRAGKATASKSPWAVVPSGDHADVRNAILTFLRGPSWFSESYVVESSLRGAPCPSQLSPSSSQPNMPLGASRP
jgi:hypothetical protein